MANWVSLDARDGLGWLHSQKAHYDVDYEIFSSRGKMPVHQGRDSALVFGSDGEVGRELVCIPAHKIGLCSNGLPSCSQLFDGIRRIWQGVLSP